MGRESSIKIGAYDDDGSRTTGNATPKHEYAACPCRQISQFGFREVQSRAWRRQRSKCLGGSADKRRLSAARSRPAIADLQNALPGRLFELSTRPPPR